MPDQVLRYRISFDDKPAEEAAKRVAQTFDNVGQAGAKAAQTAGAAWRNFVSDNMAAATKAAGNSRDALKQLAQQWQAVKSGADLAARAGVAATEQVGAGARRGAQSVDVFANSWAQASYRVNAFQHLTTSAMQSVASNANIARGSVDSMANAFVRMTANTMGVVRGVGSAIQNFVVSPIHAAKAAADSFGATFSARLTTLNAEAATLKRTLDTVRPAGQWLGTSTTTSSRGASWGNVTDTTGATEAAKTHLKETGDAARKAASSFTTMRQSLTGSIVEAGIFISVLQTSAHWFKELTVGTALYAARVEQLKAAEYAVGQAHGYSAQQVAAYEARIHGLGVSLEETRGQLTQMMAVGIDPKYGSQLAQLAQNIGRVRGLPTSEVYEKMTTAIITQRTQELHYLGIMALVEPAQKKYAAAIGTTVDRLTDEQRVMAMINEVLQKGAGYNEAYAASLGTIGGKLQSFPRLIADLKNTIGQGFGAELEAVAGPLYEVMKRWNDFSSGKNLPKPNGVSADPGAVSQRQRDAASMAGAAVTTGMIGAGTGLLMVPEPTGLTKLAGAALIAAGAVGKLGSVVSDVSEWIAQTKLENRIATASYKEIGDMAREDNAARVKDLVPKVDKAAMGTLQGAVAAKRAMTNRQALDLSNMTPDELFKHAMSTATQQANADTDWAQKDRTRFRQAERAVMDAQSTGLEGLHATRARYTQMRYDMSLDANGAQRPLGPAVETQLRQAENSAVANQMRKEQLQLERDIAGEKANQLEGAHKILAQTDAQVALLKQQGYGEKSIQVALAESLGQERVRTQLIETQRSTEDAAHAAQRGMLEGYAKISAEIQARIDKLSDEDIIDGKILDNLRQQEAAERRLLDIQNARETRKLAQADRLDAMQAGIGDLERERELRLNALETTNAYDLRSKLTLEQKKYDVSIDYIGRVADAQRAMRRAQYDQELADLQEQYNRQLINLEDFAMRSGLILRKRDRDLRASELDQDKATIEATRQHAKTQSDMVHDQIQKTYDSLKQASGGVFDSMLRESDNVFAAIGKSFKNMWLTALKEVVTSEVAKTLMQLLYGVTVTGGVNGKPVQASGDTSGIIGGSAGKGGILGAIFGGMKFLADGGYADARKPVVVGERGPELFVPETGGQVIPNHMLRFAADGAYDTAADFGTLWSTTVTAQADKSPWERVGEALWRTTLGAAPDMLKAFGTLAFGSTGERMTLGAGIAQAQAEQFGKAATWWKRGERVEAMGHGLAGALPLVGPAAANAGERIGSGDIAGGLTEGAVLVGSMFLGPETAWKAGRAGLEFVEGAPRGAGGVLNSYRAAAPRAAGVLDAYRQWRDRPVGYEFVSPNVEENLDFATARARTRSDEQARVMAVSADVDRSLGLRAQSRAAIGDWADGAENTIVTTFKRGATYEDIRYSAAVKGAMANQKAVIPFIVDKSGTDALYHIQFAEGVGKTREALNASGVQFRTLLENKGTTDVLVFDPGSGLGENISKLANDYGHVIKDITKQRGRGEFLGGDTRVAGLREYERVIADYEAAHPRRYGRDGGGSVSDTSPLNYALNAGRSTLGGLARFWKDESGAFTAEEAARAIRERLKVVGKGDPMDATNWREVPFPVAHRSAIFDVIDTLAGDDGDFISGALKRGAKVEPVPVGALKASQPFVRGETVDHFLQNGVARPKEDPIFVIERAGQYYLADGHHGATAAKMLDHPTVDAIVYHAEPQHAGIGQLAREVFDDFLGDDAGQLNLNKAARDQMRIDLKAARDLKAKQRYEARIDPNHKFNDRHDLSGGQGQGMNWIAKPKRMGIYDRDGFRCIYCGKSPATHGDAHALTLDHVIPHKLGGGNTANNLVTSCDACNSLRKDTPMPEWAKRVSREIDKSLTPAQVIAKVDRQTDIAFYRDPAKAALAKYNNKWTAALEDLTAKTGAGKSHAYALVDLFGDAIDKLKPEYRANGGPLKAGQLTVVGERGPELFIPDAPGQVIPNHALQSNPISGNAIRFAADGAFDGGRLFQVIAGGVLRSAIDGAMQQPRRPMDEKPDLNAPLMGQMARISKDNPIPVFVVNIPQESPLASAPTYSALSTPSFAGSSSVYAQQSGRAATGGIPSYYDLAREADAAGMRQFGGASGTEQVPYEHADLPATLGGQQGGGMTQIAASMLMKGNLKHLFGQDMSSVPLGAGRATTTATMGGKLSAGLQSPAAAMIGGMLYLDSLNQKGVRGTIESGTGGALLGYKLSGGNPFGALAGSGAAMMTQAWAQGHGAKGYMQSIGGGAMAGAGIGMMVGGPMGALVGAAIGAGVGAVGGLFALFRKTPEEKMRDEIKAAYGIDVTEKSVLKQAADIAKQSFGGDYRLAARSNQVKELVMLYSQMTGKDANSNARLWQNHEVTVRQEGGKNYLMASNWNNGSPEFYKSAFSNYSYGANAGTTNLIAEKPRIAAYASGGDVTSDQIALLHKNEMVLPREIADELRAMIARLKATNTMTGGRADLGASPGTSTQPLGDEGFHPWRAAAAIWALGPLGVLFGFGHRDNSWGRRPDPQPLRNIMEQVRASQPAPAATSSSNAPTILRISMDADATTQYHEGKTVTAIAKNPSAVRRAQQSEMTSNRGRSDLRRLVLAPNQVLR